jgi:hypothetical protein
MSHPDIKAAGWTICKGKIAQKTASASPKRWHTGVPLWHQATRRWAIFKKTAQKKKTASQNLENDNKDIYTGVFE